MICELCGQGECCCLCRETAQLMKEDGEFLAALAVKAGLDSQDAKRLSSIGISLRSISGEMLLKLDGGEEVCITYKH